MSRLQMKNLPQSRSNRRSSTGMELFDQANNPPVNGTVIVAQRLSDADREVRQAAAEALGAMGPLATEAVPALVVAVSDADRDVREAAAEAPGGGAVLKTT